MNKILEVTGYLPKQIAKVLIRVYQKTLSFDHSFWANPKVYRVCIHEPSCSEYTYQAIDKHGILKGGIMGVARISRCNPLNKGGYDPVPDHFSLRHSHTKTE